VSDSTGELIGIISERDLLRQWSKSDIVPSRIKVKDIMTKEVTIGMLDDDIGSIMEIMTQKRIRHLPVVVGSKIEGMISYKTTL
jgi:CBS domain-containing protein